MLTMPSLAALGKVRGRPRTGIMFDHELDDQMPSASIHHATVAEASRHTLRLLSRSDASSACVKRPSHTLIWDALFREHGVVERSPVHAQFVNASGSRAYQTTSGRSRDAIVERCPHHASGRSALPLVTSWCIGGPKLNFWRSELSRSRQPRQD